MLPGIKKAKNNALYKNEDQRIDFLQVTSQFLLESYELFRKCLENVFEAFFIKLWIIQFLISDIFCNPKSLIPSWNLKCFATTAATATATTAAVNQLAKKVVFVLISLRLLTHYAKNPIK